MRVGERRPPAVGFLRGGGRRDADLPSYQFWDADLPSYQSRDADPPRFCLKQKKSGAGGAALSAY